MADLQPGRYVCANHGSHPGSPYSTPYTKSKSLSCNGVRMDFDRELNAAELKEIADDERRVERELARQEVS